MVGVLFMVLGEKSCFSKNVEVFKANKINLLSVKNVPFAL